MEISFCEYLINIGFINKESFSNIIIEYHKKYSNNNNFKDNMTQILNIFIENLSEVEKKYMSLNLVQYYLDYIRNKTISKFKKMCMIFKGRIRLVQLKYFYKLKYFIQSYSATEKKVNGINDIGKVNDEEKDHDKDKNNNYKSTNKLNKKNNKQKQKIYKTNRNDMNYLDKNNPNFISMKINNKYIEKFQFLFNNNPKNKSQISSQNESTLKKHDSTKENSIRPIKKNVNILQSSLALKEQKELKECTFSPKINISSVKKNSDKDINDNKEISSKKKNFI